MAKPWVRLASTGTSILPVSALTMQTLSWSLKLFITSNNVNLESK